MDLRWRRKGPGGIRTKSLAERSGRERRRSETLDPHASQPASQSSRQTRANTRLQHSNPDPCNHCTLQHSFPAYSTRHGPLPFAPQTHLIRHSFVTSHHHAKIIAPASSVVHHVCMYISHRIHPPRLFVSFLFQNNTTPSQPQISIIF